MDAAYTIRSAEQVNLGQCLISEGNSMRDVARIFNCHHAALYRALSNSSDGDAGNGVCRSAMLPPVPVATFQSRL